MWLLCDKCFDFFDFCYFFLSKCYGRRRRGRNVFLEIGVVLELLFKKFREVGGFVIEIRVSFDFVCVLGRFFER